MSPISSRNSVPPEASSNLPARASWASVKAPFSWPNSSLSSNVSVRAAQLTAMNGSLRRRLPKWIARATTSLPVPFSPRIRMARSVSATRPDRGTEGLDRRAFADQRMSPAPPARPFLVPGKQLGELLGVLERDGGVGGQFDQAALVLGGEGAVVLVQELERAEPRSVAA